METKAEEKQLKSGFARRIKDDISIPDLRSIVSNQVEVAHDLRWFAYVSQLDPDDDQSAFLLPDELPGESSSREEILTALVRAARRAFGLGSNITKLQLKDYELGYIRGELRVLLPQGREGRLNFKDELGWKAIAIIGEGEEERELICYYRSLCMNPARLASLIDADIDSSKVEFRPIGSEEIEKISANPEVDRMTQMNMRMLRSQYQRLVEQGLLRTD
jgi:hypothetical protein